MEDPDKRTRRQVLAAAAGVSAVGVLGRVLASDDAAGSSSAFVADGAARATRPAGGPDVKWTRRYHTRAATPTPDEEAPVWVKSVVAEPGGGFTLAGHEVYGEGSDDFVLMKTDAEGTRQWLREYDGTDDRDTAEAHLRAADGGYLLVGQYTRDEEQTAAAGTPEHSRVRRPFVVRTDADGAETWRVVPGDDEAGELVDCVQTDAGRFVAVGWIDDGASRASWLVALDGSGETVLDRRYHSENDGPTRTENAGGEPRYDDRLATVALASDGDLLLGGAGNQGGHVVWVDSAGDIRWEVDLGYQRATVEGVAERADGDVVVTGRFYETDGGNIQTNTGDGSNLYLSLLAADGSQRWTETYDGDRNEGGLALVGTDDGGVAAVGTSQTRGGRSDMFAVKATADGTERWSATYPDEEDHPNDAGTDLVQTADGGYVVAARTYVAKLSGGYTPTETPTPSETASGTPTDSETATRATSDTETQSRTPVGHIDGAGGDADLGDRGADTASDGEGDCTI